MSGCVIVWSAINSPSLTATVYRGAGDIHNTLSRWWPPPSLTPGGRVQTVNGIQLCLGLQTVNIIMSNSSTNAPFTELGFEINNFRFAVKIPKIRLRRPRLLTKRRQVVMMENLNSSDSGRTSCSSRFQRKFDSYNNKSDQNSISTDPSFTSDEWIKEFNARCKSVPQIPIPKIHKSEEAEDVEKNFYANIPTTTSTPVSCKIIPLNRLLEDDSDKKMRFLPNVSGIKIYETLDLGSDGNEVDTSSDDSNCHSDDYETVQFKNHQIVPNPNPTQRTLFRPPRTLKSSCR